MKREAQRSLPHSAPPADPGAPWAGRLFEHSMQTLAGLSARLEWARACRAYAQLLGRQGRQSQAQSYEEQVRRLYAEIGLPWPEVQRWPAERTYRQRRRRLQGLRPDP